MRLNIEYDIEYGLIRIFLLNESFNKNMKALGVLESK